MSSTSMTCMSCLRISSTALIRVCKKLLFLLPLMFRRCHHLRLLLRQQLPKTLFCYRAVTTHPQCRHCFLPAFHHHRRYRHRLFIQQALPVEIFRPVLSPQDCPILLSHTPNIPRIPRLPYPASLSQVWRIMGTAELSSMGSGDNSEQEHISKRQRTRSKIRPILMNP